MKTSSLLLGALLGLGPVSVSSAMEARRPSAEEQQLQMSLPETEAAVPLSCQSTGHSCSSDKDCCSGACVARKSPAVGKACS